MNPREAQNVPRFAPIKSYWNSEIRRMKICRIQRRSASLLPRTRVYLQLDSIEDSSSAQVAELVDALA